MEAPKLSGGGATQIDDLPPCLIINILSRLPIETLVNSRFVCKSWFLLFSDPMFVRLQLARSPTSLLSRRLRLKRDLKRYKSVGAMVGKDFEIDSKVRIPLPDSRFCYNSCQGLLCFRKGYSIVDEIYVCNPILGEYITIPIVNRKIIAVTPVQFVLGFSSRSNQFKVLQICSVGQFPDSAYNAEIYTIGTRQWREISIPPSCTILNFHDGPSFLNGSIHWADERNHQIVYFDFESEQFGSLPGPPAWCDGRWSHVRVSASDGCLCIYAFGYVAILEKWAMKEYGVEESWTGILSTHNNNIELERWADRTTYCPSFISLQDVAKSEHLTVLSKTRTKYHLSAWGVKMHMKKLLGMRDCFKEV